MSFRPSDNALSGMFFGAVIGIVGLTVLSGSVIFPIAASLAVLLLVTLAVRGK